MIYSGDPVVSYFHRGRSEGILIWHCYHEEKFKMWGSLGRVQSTVLVSGGPAFSEQSH